MCVNISSWFHLPSIISSSENATYLRLLGCRCDKNKPWTEIENNAEIQICNSDTWSILCVCVQGINYLVENKLLDGGAQSIAEFLYKEEGLNKTAIGEFLGERWESGERWTDWRKKRMRMEDKEVKRHWLREGEEEGEQGEEQKVWRRKTRPSPISISRVLP